MPVEYTIGKTSTLVLLFDFQLGDKEPQLKFQGRIAWRKKILPRQQAEEKFWKMWQIRFGQLDLKRSKFDLKACYCKARPAKIQFQGGKSSFTSIWFLETYLFCSRLQQALHLQATNQSKLQVVESYLDATGLYYGCNKLQKYATCDIVKSFLTADRHLPMINMLDRWAGTIWGHHEIGA